MKKSGNTIRADRYKTGHRQRIREKFIRHGDESFFDYELLELLLTYALPRKDVKPLANAMMAHFHSLRDLFATPMEELLKFPGIGENTAALVKLTGALSKHMLRRGLEDCGYMDHPEKFCDYARLHLCDHTKEALLVFSLNAKNRLLDVRIVSEGSLDAVTVEPGEVARTALLAHAKSIVLCHNHPSGSVCPSIQDDVMTRDLRRLLERLNIMLLDHIIVSRYDYHSYREADNEKPLAARLLAPVPSLNNPRS